MSKRRPRPQFRLRQDDRGVTHVDVDDDGFAALVSQVCAERVSQTLKHGTNYHHEPVEWTSLLAEEVGEAAKAANQAHWSPMTHDQIPLRVQRWRDYRAELVQVAAVALAAIESLDRNELHEG